MDSKTKKKTPKQQRKAVLSVLLVVAILITTAFAFLSATDSKTNVFTVGNVDIELHEIFNGRDYGKGEDPGAIGDKIENIVPGQSIEKAPYVVNTGKNPAYTFIAVGIPTDTSANVYNGQGTYTAKSELDIKVKAYAIQQQYNGATNAEETWTNYFKNSMISGTASDAGIELFTLNDGTSAVTTGTHTIGSDWQEFSTPYSVNDGGNTYTYHFFKYVANNELLPVGTTTAHLFDKVIFNENIGGDTPPQTRMVTINYLIPEDDTDTLAGKVNLAAANDIPEGYNLVESKTVMPGESIGDVYWDVTLDKSVENKTCEYIDEETGKTIYSNQSLYKDTNAILTYSDAGYENIVPQKYLCFSSDTFIGVHSSYWSEVNINNEPCTVVIPSTLDYSQADVLGKVSGVNDGDNAPSTFVKTSIGCIWERVSGLVETYKRNGYKASVTQIQTTRFIIDNPENLYTATRTPEYDNLSEWESAGFEANPETYRYTLKEEYKNAQISLVIPSSASYVSLGEAYLDFVAPNVFGRSGDRGILHDAHRFTPINNIDVAFGTTYFSCNTLVNNINLPASLTKIGRIATKQSEISIPDGVSIIQLQCFSDSNGFLKNITLPKNLQNICVTSLPRNAMVNYQGSIEDFELCVTDDGTGNTYTPQERLEIISNNGSCIICSDGFIKDGYKHYTTESPDEHLTEIVESLPHKDEIGMVWPGHSNFSCDCGYSYGVSTYL